MPLTLSSSYCTRTGVRAANEDFVGMVTPNEPELSSKGVLVALADGVSGSAGGREAAEYAVRGLLADYYATPDTWEVTTALERVLQAVNGWVQNQARVRRELAGMATTLTALVLRGRMYYTAHVGDTRCYLYRAGKLTRLTQDHVWDHPEMQHVLTRALGLDSHLALDHGMGELRENDVFLLASDGVWNALPEYELERQLGLLASAASSVDEISQSLCQAALDAGSQDNASVALVHITTLPAGELRDALSVASALPLPPRLKPGQSLDGYLIEEILHSSRLTILYRVREPQHGRMLVLKTLQPDYASDSAERSAFAHEAWLAKRVVARFFAQVIASENQRYLYYLTTYHAGASWQNLLDNGRHFTVPEVISQGEKLVRAIAALHRRSILHRDIKPANVHLGEDGEIRLLDLGVAQSGLDSAQQTTTLAGTPSYLAPEQFSGASASRQSDIYAVGVTLYFLLTRHYPYGEVEAFQHPRFGNAIPPSRYRPDLPLWLENVVLKAITLDPTQRFETAEEFLLALERGGARPLSAPAPRPLMQRDPTTVWRSLALVLLVINILLLYVLLIK